MAVVQTVLTVEAQDFMFFSLEKPLAQDNPICLFIQALTMHL